MGRQRVSIGHERYKMYLQPAKQDDMAKMSLIVKAEVIGYGI